MLQQCTIFWNVQSEARPPQPWEKHRNYTLRSYPDSTLHCVVVLVMRESLTTCHQICWLSTWNLKAVYDTYTPWKVRHKLTWRIFSQLLLVQPFGKRFHCWEHNTYPALKSSWHSWQIDLESTCRMLIRTIQAQLHKTKRNWWNRERWLRWWSKMWSFNKWKTAITTV